MEAVRPQESEEEEEQIEVQQPVVVPAIPEPLNFDQIDIIQNEAKEEEKEADVEAQEAAAKEESNAKIKNELDQIE